MLQVQTIRDGWDRADEAAQVIGAIAGHSRHAVRRLDAGFELASDVAGDVPAVRPSAGWAGLLGRLQAALEQGTRIPDGPGRAAEFDRAVRAAAAFLAAEALTIGQAGRHTDHRVQLRLEQLTDPALATAERLQDWADAAPSRGRGPREIAGFADDFADDTVQEPPVPGPDRSWWCPAAIGAVFALAGIALMLGLHTAAFAVSFVGAPAVFLTGCILAARRTRVRAPRRRPGRRPGPEEIARCGRSLDRQASYLALYRSNLADLGRLLEDWAMACDRAGITTASLDLAQVRDSLQHCDAAATAVIERLLAAARDAELLADETPCRGDGRPPGTSPAYLGEFEDLLRRLTGCARRTAELGSNLPLRLASSTPVPGVQVATLQIHLWQIANGVRASSRQIHAAGAGLGTTCQNAACP